MKMDDTSGVIILFDGLENPRKDRKKLYPLREILFLSLFGVMAGLKSWRGIKTFSKSGINWLKKCLLTKICSRSKNIR